MAMMMMNSDGGFETFTVGHCELWILFIGTLLHQKCIELVEKYFISCVLKISGYYLEAVYVVLCSIDKNIHKILHYRVLNYSFFRLLKKIIWNYNLSGGTFCVYFCSVSLMYSFQVIKWIYNSSSMKTYGSKLKIRM